MNLVEIVNVPALEQIVFHRIDMTRKNIGGGIYRMIDTKGQVCYVGKSGNLWQRMKRHINKQSHIEPMMDETYHIEWHQEPDPVYQTLLESMFIAFHLPKYNHEVIQAKKKFGDDYGQK